MNVVALHLPSQAGNRQQNLQDILPDRPKAAVHVGSVTRHIPWRLGQATRFPALHNGGELTALAKHPQDIF